MTQTSNRRSAALIYPHQLYRDHPALVGAAECWLVEDPLFFRQYRFHAQKLVLHRASMQRYADELRARGHTVRYIEASELSHTSDIARLLQRAGIVAVRYVEPNDDWLARRLAQGLDAAQVESTVLQDPHFLTTDAQFNEFIAERPKLFFTEFYVRQRTRLGVLLDARGRPVGGKWSYDPANRKKLPADLPIPRIDWPAADSYVRAACRHVDESYRAAPGESANFVYPTSHEQVEKCLRQFIEQRLSQFGDYEDAIVRDETFLFHSVLTPALNIGLLSPQQVLDAAIARAADVPLNSLEGFVRQIIGWREYMRGVYRFHGRRQRTTNFWQHHRRLPAAFYDGTTGIDPVDTVIRRVLGHAFCHHIERLMILGNFMLLCEIDPRAIYQWFMELFIDAYDWVMVPNVFGMSQYADGGLITTKPYISGSSYVLRMSNFRKGPWCAVWDALYWRFIDRHRAFFAANPRMSVMVSQCDRLGTRLKQHHQVAESFLEKLDRASGT